MRCWSHRICRQEAETWTRLLSSLLTLFLPTPVYQPTVRAGLSTNSVTHVCKLSTPCQTDTNSHSTTSVCQVLVVHLVYPLLPVFLLPFMVPAETPHSTPLCSVVGSSLLLTNQGSLGSTLYSVLVNTEPVSRLPPDLGAQNPASGSTAHKPDPITPSPHLFPTCLSASQAYHQAAHPPSRDPCVSCTRTLRSGKAE